MIDDLMKASGILSIMEINPVAQQKLVDEAYAFYFCGGVLSPEYWATLSQASKMAYTTARTQMLNVGSSEADEVEHAIHTGLPTAKEISEEELAESLEAFVKDVA